MAISELLKTAAKDPASARGLAVWLVAAPVGIHCVVVFMVGWDVDSSGAVLAAVVIAAAVTGFVLGKGGYGPIGAALASAYPPALFAWTHLYWTLDMHSPGGAAQSLVEWAGWRGASAPLALAAVAAASAAPGWGLMRFDGWWQRRTGRSLFDDSAA